MKHFKKVLLLLVTVMLGVCCFGLAACGEKAPEKVDVNSIKFDGSAFTWDAVEGATTYLVDLNDTSENVYTNKSKTLSIGDDLTEITIKIIAKNDVGQSEEVGKVFTRLETIEEITFDDDGVASWDSIDGATGYVVNLNGKDVTSDNVTSFSDFEYGKKNEIKVRPIGADGTFSTFCKSVKKHYLAIPTDISYDGDKISWTGDREAEGYNVYVNNGALGDKGNVTTTKTYYAYTHEKVGKSFTITVESVGDGKDVFSSKISEGHTCIKLDDVSGVTVDSGVLVWDSVTGATGYEIKFGENAPISVTENKYNKISAGTNYLVKIRAISKEASDSESCFSYFPDNPTNIYILNAPTIKWNSSLSLDGESQKALYWDDVDGVKGYKVRVKKPSGETFDEDTGSSTWLDYDYLESGKYEIAVSSVAEIDSGKFDSLFSDTFTVWRLAAPTLERGSISSNATTYSGFTVKFNSADGANGYDLYREGVKLSSSSSREFTVSSDNVLDNTNASKGGDVNYTIRSTGNVSNNMVKLSSLTAAKDKCEFVITVRPTPSGLDIGESTLTWNSVANAANGYYVKIGDTISEPAQNSSYNLSLNVGAHNIGVCAAGNGSDILASPYTTSIHVVKLEAPSNIKVDTSNDNGKLTWIGDSSNKATSTYVYFNNNQVGIDAKQMNSLDSYIVSGNGVIVNMQEMADYWDNDTYYISSEKSQSVQFTRINPIVAADAGINGYNLTWPEAKNTSTAANGKITYRVYDQNQNNKRIASTDTNSLDLSTYKAGVYAFYIICIGDGVELFNSEKSGIISVTKLEAVDFSVNDTNDGFTWNYVSQAEGYSFKINGKEVKNIPAESGKSTYEVKTSEFYSSEMNTAGQYEISVTALGNASASTKLMDSSATTKTQQVTRLGTPQISLSYSANCVSDDGNIVATINSAIANANGYSYSFGSVNGGTKSSDGLTCSYNAPYSGEYKVSVYAKGGKFDSTGIMYCDSLPSEEQSIILLGTSSLDLIEVEDNNLINWGDVSGADSTNGYTVTVTYSDGSKDEDKFCAYSQYNADINKVVSKVEIQANGNGTNKITSKKFSKSWT